MARLEITCRSCGERIRIKSAGRRAVDGKTQLMEDENGHVIISKVCHDCKLKYQRKHRQRGGYENTQKRYEKTVNGMLIRRLQALRRWGWGIDKDEFYKWAKRDEEFLRLYKEWRDSGYRPVLSPCVVVIDLSKPPSPENCAWVPYVVKRGLNLMETRSGRISAPTRQRRRNP